MDDINMISFVELLHREFSGCQIILSTHEEDPWAEDVMQILSEIKDPAMRTLAIDQLKCIARIS